MVEVCLKEFLDIQILSWSHNIRNKTRVALEKSKEWWDIVSLGHQGWIYLVVTKDRGREREVTGKIWWMVLISKKYRHHQRRKRVCMSKK